MQATPAKRRSITELVQNGVGLLITRWIIIAIPFVATGSLWAGKTIIELNADRLVSAIDRLNSRLDKLSAIVETTNDRLHSVETIQAAQGAKLDGLKERFDDQQRGRK